jgi:hypothetical protein
MSSKWSAIWKQGDQIGRILAQSGQLGICFAHFVLKITKVAGIFVLLFSICQKIRWQHFGRFFSPTHPVTLIVRQPREEEKLI